MNGVRLLPDASNARGGAPHGAEGSARARTPRLLNGLRLAAAWVAGMLALPGLGGCAALHRAALRRTEVFYRAETVQKLPEKPPDFLVPVLNARPRGSRVLGTLEFTTERSAEFAMESARHNARKCGADAVWMRGLRQWAEPYTQYVPAQTNFTPSAQWISGPVWRPAPGGGRWQRGGAFVQTFGLYYSPPYLVSGWSRFTAIDAVMLQLAPTPPAKPQ